MSCSTAPSQRAQADLLALLLLSLFTTLLLALAACTGSDAPSDASKGDAQDQGGRTSQNAGARYRGISGAAASDGAELPAEARPAPSPEMVLDGLAAHRDEELEEAVESESYEGGDADFADLRRARLRSGADEGDPPASASGDKKGKAADPATDVPKKRVRQRPELAKLLVPGPEGRLAGLELQGLTVYAEVEGPRARIYLDHVFHNPHDRQLEGTFFCPLPDGASVTWFGMFQSDPASAPAPAPTAPLLRSDPELPLASAPGAVVGALAAPATEPQPDDRNKRSWGELREARIVEARAARRVYEEIVRRQIDPALLEWAGGNTFKGRVFPIPAKGQKRVVLAFERTLPRTEDGVHLHIPLPDEALKELHVRVVVDEKHIAADRLNLGVEPVSDGGVRSYAWDLAGKAPEVDLEYTFRPTGGATEIITGRRAGAPAAEEGYFYARLQPEIPAIERRFAERALFLLDTSLSEEPQRFELYLKLLREVLERDAGLKAFNVLSFDLRPRWAAEGWLENTPENRAKIFALLDQTVLEGATCLDAAARAVAAADFIAGGEVDLFVLSDGNITWGSDDPREILAAFARCPAALRFYAYRLGAGAVNAELFHALARAGGALFDCPTEEKLAEAALAHTRQPMELIDLRIQSAGLVARELLLEGSPRDLYPGQELRLAGRFTGAGPAEVVLRVRGVDGERELRLPLAVTVPGESPVASLAARAWGELQVAQLARERNPRLGRLLIAYAQRFGVSCKQASFLVLEEDADYLLYDVEGEEAAAADPSLMAAFADWRVNAELARDFDRAPAVAEEALLAHACDILAGLRAGGALDEPLTAGVQALVERQRSDGDLRRGAESLHDQAVAAEALATAACFAPGYKPAAQRALDFLSLQQHDQGSFGTDRRRAPHAAVTLSAARAYRAARRAGLVNVFQPTLKLDTWLRTAPWDAAEMRFAAPMASLLAVRGFAPDDERLVALRARLESWLLAEILRPVEQDLEVLADAWEGLHAATPPAWLVERTRPLLERLAGVALPEGGHRALASLALSYARAHLVEPCAATRAKLAELDAKVRNDPASLFLSLPLDRILDRAPASLPALASRAVLSKEERVAYLAARANNPDDIELYVRTARLRFERGDELGALRTLSCIVERNPHESQALRLVGYFLMDWGQLDAARGVFRRVLERRPFEPHSHRDLAGVYRKLGHHALAAVEYETVLSKAWHNRFRQMNQVVQDEYVRALGEFLEQRAELPPELKERFAERIEQLGAAALKPVDLRVTIAWNTDSTDIDLWVTEPSGEKCFYSHKTTKGGGVLLEDLTGGYGPERYQIPDAPAGRYLVQAHYYSVNPNQLGGLSFVTATIAKNAGSPEEEIIERTIVLRKHNEVGTLAEIVLP